eukprot:CAMPEP_0195122404 /NCGR_PEP_ID=MMETSP0448-20130528/126364_1 /TAXON_ID=66468 /ORGANISM="Heterocapsa triquestra, Strain CCMP 448" /LENGTH=76 /DNA_ID=CAMNT_0040159897 /DNA_START=134 /DNA_END=362 /DNA_ORIENTATION=-
MVIAFTSGGEVKISPMKAIPAMPRAGTPRGQRSVVGSSPMQALDVDDVREHAAGHPAPQGDPTPSERQPVVALDMT